MGSVPRGGSGGGRKDQVGPAVAEGGSQGRAQLLTKPGASRPKHLLGGPAPSSTGQPRRGKSHVFSYIYCEPYKNKATNISP